MPVIALMMPFSMALAAEMSISPLLLAQIGILGCCAGGISPIAPTSIIGVTLAARQGITGIEIPYFINSLLAQTIWATALYLILGGHRLRCKASASKNLPPLGRNQVLTLFGMAALVTSVLCFRLNVGLMAFVVASLPTLAGAADERDAVLGVPWGTLILVTGVGVLMELAIALGGIKILAAFLARFMTEQSASRVMAMTAGIMSWFSSTSGVVMPTLIPTVSEIVTAVGPRVSPLDLISAITNTAHCAGTSPVSTGGALALAAYVTNARPSEEKQHRLFIQMFAASAAGLVFLTVLARLGIYRLVQ